jgi:hypothetical protein
MLTYEIQWTAGNNWGISYVDARSEKIAHKMVRLQLTGLAKMYATLTTISSYK